MEPTKKKMSSPREFIDAGDYSGGLAFVKHKIRSYSGPPDSEEIVQLKMWQGYLCYCVGKSAEALETYQSLLGHGESLPSTAHNKDLLTVYMACCYYRMQKYEESRDLMKDAIYPEANTRSLANRLLINVAQSLSDEFMLMKHHNMLADTVEDQMTLAYIHTMRHHFQEAADVYQKICQDSGTKYPIAKLMKSTSHYNLEYYEVAFDLLKDEGMCFFVASIRTACQYSLHGGPEALEIFEAFKGTRKENVLKYDILRHNNAIWDPSVPNVMRAKNFSAAVNTVPIARYNLAAVLLKQKKYTEAYELFNPIEPATPMDYVMKGLTLHYKSMETDDQKLLKKARELFQLVGSSASECDTIQGRMCMAYVFIILNQYDDALVYLESVSVYFHDDQNFRYMHGLVLFLAGRWSEGKDIFSALDDPAIVRSEEYFRWVIRCHCRMDQPVDAWKLCEELLNFEGVNKSEILKQFADDSYVSKHYYQSALAFAQLRELFPEESPAGLRGAVVGALKRFVDGEWNENVISAVMECAKKDSSCDDICELYADYIQSK